MSDDDFKMRLIESRKLEPDQHDTAVAAAQVLARVVSPRIHALIAAVTRFMPPVNHAIVILHTAEGLVATTVAGSEDMDLNLKVMASATALLETQKVKS